MGMMRPTPAGWIVTREWPTMNAPTYDGWAVTLYAAEMSPDTLRDQMVAASVHLGPETSG